MRRILWQRISRSLFFRSYLAAPRVIFLSRVHLSPPTLSHCTHSQASYLRALFSPRENADRRFCYFISPFIAPLDFLPFILLSFLQGCGVPRSFSVYTTESKFSHPPAIAISRLRYHGVSPHDISREGRTPHIFPRIFFTFYTRSDSRFRTFSITIANCRSMSTDRSRYIFVAAKYHRRIDN